jgi:hypothetical protein
LVLENCFITSVYIGTTPSKCQALHPRADLPTP